MTAPHRDDALSFIERRKPMGSGFNYWDVKPSGNYGEDCDTGHALAEEYLAYIGTNPTYGNGTLLTCIVHEMIDQAKDGHPWSGVHVGFLAGINRYAMAAAQIVIQPPPTRPERPKLRQVRDNDGGQS